MSVWTLIALVMLGEALLHYFPWRTLLKGKELPRLAAYTLGLLAITVPFTGWLWQSGDLETIAVMWIVNFSAGITVLALYGLDHYLDLIMRDMEATEREQRHGKEG
jgi:hypothetical protein